ncbi:hypothetical protein MAHJHV59_49530 [Mycobacterium avium subsp. hominissuis]
MAAADPVTTISAHQLMRAVVDTGAAQDLRQDHPGVAAGAVQRAGGQRRGNSGVILSQILRGVADVTATAASMRANSPPARAAAVAVTSATPRRICDVLLIGVE